MSIFKGIGKFAPPSTKEKIAQLISHAGMNLQAEELIGLSIVAYIIIGILAYSFSVLLGYIQLNPLTFLAFFTVLALLEISSIYMVLSINAERRRKQLEAILPEFFSLVASNLRAGMPLDQAIWHAAKPEFGILSKEVKTIIKESFSGTPLPEALRKLGGRFNSPLFQKAIKLLTEASVSGGEIVRVLDMTSQHIRESILTKREIASSLLMYKFFIVFALLMAPILFAISMKLLLLMERVIGMVPKETMATPVLRLAAEMPVNMNDFRVFVYLVLLLSTFSSSLIIGVIEEGRAIMGLKYFVPLLIVVFVIFFGSEYLLTIFFPTMI